MKRRKLLKINKKLIAKESTLLANAASTEDQIRFYLYYTNKYFSAIEFENKILITEGTDNTMFHNTSSQQSPTLKIINIFSYLISLGIGFINFKYFKNIISSIFIMNLLYLLIGMLFLIFYETCHVSNRVKSKHAAEHMLVNYINLNQKLPESMKEIHMYSRFSPHCGSRYLVKDISENFVGNTICFILSFIFSTLLKPQTNTELFSITFFLLTYWGFKIGIISNIKRDHFLYVLVNPFQILLSYIIQCINTTSQVKTKDIVLAYMAAEYWIKNAYPHLYNQETSRYFYKKYLIDNID